MMTNKMMFATKRPYDNRDTDMLQSFQLRTYAATFSHGIMRLSPVTSRTR
jgi:hypothetical protein